MCALRSWSTSVIRSAASSAAMRCKNGCGLLIGALFQELDLMFGVQLLEDVGFELGVGVDGLDDLLALVVRGCSTMSAIWAGWRLASFR